MTHGVLAKLFADSDLDSAIAQFLTLSLALMIGRFRLKSRSMIWLVSFLTAFIMMYAKMAVDGQGAFLPIMYAPVIYAISTVYRRDLDKPRPGSSRPPPPGEDE